MNRKNSYDFLRLFAAIIVVFSHSMALSGHEEWTIGDVSLGTIAVWIFFILSGYLIAISWDQYPRFNVFFAKRALRIFPGLIVNVVLTLLIVGAFYSALPFWEFITTKGSLDFLNNILLYPRKGTLPGAFLENPFPKEVNGSLWTLPYEFTMYLMVALLGVFKVYKKVRPFTIWIGLFVLTSIFLLFNIDLGKITIFFLRPEDLILLALLFFSGIIAYKYHTKIRLHYGAGFASLLLFIVGVALFPVITPLLAAIFLAYAIFALGRSPLMSWVDKVGDLSYGIYIYSFPIQQMLVASTSTHNYLKLFIVSLLLSVTIAWLSWHFIESRALKLKSRINKKKYPLMQTDDAW